MNSQRNVLEVLKFVVPADLLLSVSSVCTHWKKCSSNDELWWTYCENEAIVPDDIDHRDPKELYRCYLREPTSLLFIRDSLVSVISAKDFSVTRYKLQTSTGVTDDNGYCFVTPVKVMCFGAKESANVCEINLRDRSVTPLLPMMEKRTYPGLLRYKRYVYVFGGRKVSCEKFSLKTASWEPIAGTLRDALEALTPALHEDAVYLAGHTTVEVFKITTETFSMLDFSLPIDWWYSLAFIHKGDLVVVQQSLVSRWPINSSKVGFDNKPMKSRGSGYWSNCIPVWWKGKLYSLHNDIPAVLGVLQFDPAKNKLKQIMTLEDLRRGDVEIEEQLKEKCDKEDSSV